MPVIITFFSNGDPGTYTLDVQRAPNQTDSDVICSRSCDQGKITKKYWKI